MIKFAYTIFYVPDVLKTVKFYEEAFGFKTKFIHESNGYAELMTEGVTLAFASNELGEMNLPEGFIKNSIDKLPQACEIAFMTDDPDKVFKDALKAGAIKVLEPKHKPWGQLVGYVRDPSGILVEICGEMK